MERRGGPTGGLIGVIVAIIVGYILLNSSRDSGASSFACVTATTPTAKCQPPGTTKPAPAAPHTTSVAAATNSGSVTSPSSGPGSTPATSSHPTSTAGVLTRPGGSGGDRKVIIPNGSARLTQLPAALEPAAVTLIQQLPTKGRGPLTGYSRAEFGPAWSDTATGDLWSGNGCRTRDDILARDLNNAGKRGACVVTSGVYVDPYTRDTITFTKATASKSPIDHVLPLAFAWQMGAARWDAAKRLRFANDPLDLVTTTEKPNSSKGDSSPASWLPSNKAIRCAYVYRFAQVTTKYQLAVPAADKAMMLRMCQ